MKLWLEIQRVSGIDKRRVYSRGSKDPAKVEGKCPGCGADPFFVRCEGARRHDRDTLKAGGYCTACGDPVGWVYARIDTIFGLEEDLRVLRGRARVY